MRKDFSSLLRNPQENDPVELTAYIQQGFLHSLVTFFFNFVWELRSARRSVGVWGAEGGSLRSEHLRCRKQVHSVVPRRPKKGGNFSFSIKKPVSSAVSSTLICFFGCSPFSLKQRAVRNQALSTDSSHHLTSPRPRIQRPGCCKFLRVCYISLQQWCLPNINGMLRKWSVFAKLKNAQWTTEGCRLILALTKGPSQA